jgi:putative tryptophan/tyrosine transport system substrate-binding protein
MERRKFILVLGGAAGAWPLRARAQQPKKLIVGWLGLTSESGEAEMISAFRKGLREAGFDDGRVSIEFRFAEGNVGRLQGLAEDLRNKSALLFTGTTAAALAAKKATSNLPIVFVIGADPVTSGLVDQLNHPGGNITGISFFTNQMEGKRLGLLHELAPNANPVAVLLNPSNPFYEAQRKDLQEASRRLGINIHFERASNENDIASAFKAVEHVHAGALLVGADLYFFSRRALVVDAATRLRVPAIYEWRQYSEAGGLMSYGTSLTQSFEQAGSYAARILKGGNPADLPVMQASKFELVLNLKTARQLGIDVPPGFSARADEVIE